MKLNSSFALAISLLGTVSLYAGFPCGNVNNGGLTKTECPGQPGATGEQVSAYTGNEQRTVDDLAISGGVGEHQLVFQRYGNSRFTNATTTFGNGHSWRHGYQWELSTTATDTNGAPKTLDLYYPNGEHNTFKLSTTPGVFLSTISIKDILYLSGTTTATLQRGNGYQYVFNFVTLTSGIHRWQLSYFLDTQQNQYTLTYNGSNQLLKVTEPGGRYLTISYSVLPYSTTTNASLNSQLALIGTPTAGWNTLSSTKTATYRYLWYKGTDNTNSAVGEIQFLNGGGTALSGTPFGSGSDPVSGQGYGNAFDGNTGSIFTSSLPSGDYIGLDLGTAAAVASIKFFPPTGNTNAMKNGQFFGSNQAPMSITVINKVQASDGRSVTYSYQQFNDASLPFSWQTLTGAQYGDGTSATYTYQQAFPGTLPLVIQAVDPRVHGQGTNMKWAYDNTDTNHVGFVVQEINGVTGSVVYQAVAAGQNTAVASFPNGAIETWKFTESTGLCNTKIDSLGAVTKYVYDQNGFPNSITDALNRVTTTVYSAYGNPLSQTKPDNSVESWTRDSLDLILTHTNELGNVTTYTRNAQHRVTRIDYPDASFETFVYNGFGEVTSHTLRNGGTESSAYDARGLKTSMANALGNVTAYTYTVHSPTTPAPSDLAASVTDALNHTTGYAYNERGLLTQRTYVDGSSAIYAYDANGDRTSVTNELGKTWNSVYDEWKRPLSVTDPLTRTTSYSYDLPGGVCGCSHENALPTKITLPSGKIAAITYDTEWQKKSQIVGFGTADAATTIYGYDLVGNVVSATDPRGKVWHGTYDNRNRPISFADPLNHTTQYTYDAVGNKLTEKRPDNGTTTNVYDAMNRLTSTNDPKNETTSFDYDSADNLLTLTDARGKAYGYTYDGLDRKLTMNYPDASIEQWSYDIVGNLATYTARAAQVCTYIYDNRNRQAGYIWSDSTPAVTNTYDAAGRLLTLTSTVDSLSYVYDDANELTSETQQIMSDGGPKTVAYFYNADGNRITIGYPSGSSVTLGYNGRNQPNSVISGAITASYTYNPSGNPLTKSLKKTPTGDVNGLFNGTIAIFAYDEANRLLAVNNQRNGPDGSASFAQYDYTYNVVDDRIGRTETINGAAKLDSYGYDQIDQVTSVKYNFDAGANTQGRQVGYNYDASGNRNGVNGVTDSTGGSSNYAANNLNQYLTAGSLTPVYDSNGNMTGQDGWSYTYDAQNRMTSAYGNGTNVTFAYDGRSRCVSRTVNGTVTFLYYDGWNLIEEHDGSDVLQGVYIHGANVDEIVARAAGGAMHYYHHDGNGNVVFLTDSNGAVEESYTYDIFGAATIKDGLGNTLSVSAIGNRFMFTGREYMEELGLYDYRNRIYSPRLGRFLQTDPIEFDAGDVNIYRYVGNNPVNWLDPDGRGFLDLVGKILNSTRPLQQRLIDALKLLGKSNKQSSAIACSAQVGAANTATGLQRAGAQLPGSEMNIPEGFSGWGVVIYQTWENGVDALSQDAFMDFRTGEVRKNEINYNPGWWKHPFGGGDGKK